MHIENLEHYLEQSKCTVNYYNIFIIYIWNTTVFLASNMVSQYKLEEQRKVEKKVRLLI